MKKTYLICAVPFLTLVLLFEIVPVAMVVVRSFMATNGDGITFQHYTDIFTKKLYTTAVYNSVLISVISALVGIVVAFLAAKAYNETEGKLKHSFMRILNMTSNFSGVPLAFAHILLLGNVGFFVNIGKALGIDALANFNVYSLSGLVITYVYFQIPLATLLLIPTFNGLKKEWAEAVSLLGGTRKDYWVKVGVPTLMPSILGTISVLFSNALAAYATAYALLQNNLSLLPIRISEQFVGDIVQRPEFGSALAVVMMALMVTSIYIKDKFIKKGEVKDA